MRLCHRVDRRIGNTFEHGVGRIGERLIDAVGKVGAHALQLIGQTPPARQRAHRVDHHRDRDDKGGQPHNQHRQMAKQLQQCRLH